MCRNAAIRVGVFECLTKFNLTTSHWGGGISTGTFIINREVRETIARGCVGKGLWNEEALASLRTTFALNSTVYRMKHRTCKFIMCSKQGCVVFCCNYVGCQLLLERNAGQLEKILYS